METTGITSGSVRDDFLQLLVTQLRHQDPLDPVAQQDFTAQLAQFSMLEELEKLNASFSDILGAQELAQSASLIGRMVSYRAEGESGYSQGIVQSVERKDDSVFVNVDGFSLPITEIRSVLSN